MKQNKTITEALIDGVHEWLKDDPEAKELLRLYGMESRNEKRQRKYQQLINAGYNSKIATKYKDYAQKHVDSLCEIKKETDQVLWERVNKQLGKLL